MKLIFRLCLKTGKFPAEWRKTSVVPAHKRGDQQNLQNYGLISLLPVAGKIFGKILYYNMYEFFKENNLISPDKSVFKPGDSCTNQLLSVTDKIYKSFDNGPEVRAIFLDILKAFDKAWHKGFLHKLKQIDISGKLFDIITDFLNFRKQRVVLNGQYSSSTSIGAVVPQR